MHAAIRARHTPCTAVVRAWPVQPVGVCTIERAACGEHVQPLHGHCEPPVQGRESRAEAHDDRDRRRQQLEQLQDPRRGARVKVRVVQVAVRGQAYRRHRIPAERRTRECGRSSAVLRVEDARGVPQRPLVVASAVGEGAWHHHKLQLIEAVARLLTGPASAWCGARHTLTGRPLRGVQILAESPVAPQAPRPLAGEGAERLPPEDSKAVSILHTVNAAPLRHGR